MTPGVFGAVLFSAVLHATWNAIAKAIPHRLVASALIGLAYLVFGGVGCFFLPVPHARAWPLLIASVLLQTAYLIMLTALYATTEFSKAYPLARGVAIIGVTLVSVAFLREPLTWLQFTGLAMVVLALLALALVGDARRRNLRGLLLSALVGAVIAAYSLVDGVAVRVSGGALGYVAWLFFLHGLTVVVTCLLLSRDRRALMAGIRRHASLGSLGGLLSLVAYGIVIWAQSVAPLSLVSAVRETSVLMAALVGFFVFRERPTLSGLSATTVAAAGLVLLRLGG